MYLDTSDTDHLTTGKKYNKTYFIHVLILNDIKKLTMFHESKIVYFCIQLLLVTQ